jgi:transcriptional regulator with XRE-family HTH domain
MPPSLAPDWLRSLSTALLGIVSVSELGRFLRTRRDALRPADVGLEPGSGRKVKGLRREEVALLADISAPYYTLLEQGRDVQPSGAVLDALARALLMSPAEHALLYRLAQDAPPITAAEIPAPGLDALVEQLDPQPTYVTGRNWDVLASNRAAHALFTDWPAVRPSERNLLWFMFADPHARYVYVEWQREAAAQLARFRAAAAHRLAEPAVIALVDRLRDASPEAAAWWAEPAVQPLSSGSKRLRNAGTGEVTLAHLVLTVADAPDQKVVTFRAPDEVLARLAPH